MTRPRDLEIYDGLSGLCAVFRVGDTRLAWAIRLQDYCSEQIEMPGTPEDRWSAWVHEVLATNKRLPLPSGWRAWTHRGQTFDTAQPGDGL